MCEQEYIIREVKQCEIGKVVSFLENHFFEQIVPLKMFMNKNKNRMTVIDKQILKEDHMKRCEIGIKNSTCFIYVDRNSEEIIGTVMADVVNHPKNSNINNKESLVEILNKIPIKSDFLKEYLQSVFDTPVNKIDYFNKFPHIKSITKIRHLCVHQNYRYQGIGTSLMRTIIDWAKTRKTDLVCGLFISPGSSELAEKLGFQTYYTFDYRASEKSDDKCTNSNEDSVTLTNMALILNDKV